MTSPEWEAANEDDSDRFPQISQESAQNSTESDERGSQAPVDPMGSEAARVARYAEAINRADDEALARTNFRQLGADYAEQARAVVAVADEEHAALVAAKAEWYELYKQANEWSWELHARAEAAEAKVAKVEATIKAKGKLHSTWDKRSEMVVPVDDLRAALADAPAEQRAEAECRECPETICGECGYCRGSVAHGDWHAKQPRKYPPISLADLDKPIDVPGLMPPTEPGEIVDPDCTCGLPVGHTGECA